MSLLNEPFSFNYFGHTITAHSHGPMEAPHISKITSVHVVPVADDGSIVAVNVTSRGWDIPGGHVDEGELSPLDSLRREVREEASISILEPALVDVLTLESETMDLSARPYMLLYAAKVRELGDFTPNNEISERSIMTAEKFVKNYFGNTTYAQRMIHLSIQATKTSGKNELADDNARKFIVGTIDNELLRDKKAISFHMIVDWLETGEENEKKVAYKKFSTGDTQILLISKTTTDGKRTSDKKKINEREYEGLLKSSILRLEKVRHEFEHVQEGVTFSIKYDEFTGGKLQILEVDAPNEDERDSFNPDDFPAKLSEVTGDARYYGYRITGIL